MTAARPETNIPRIAAPIRPEDLDPRWIVERRRGRNRTKADLIVYRTPRGRFAVKDYSERPWPIRQTLGRSSIRSECRAYRALEGLAGVPRFLGRVGPFALALEWLDAHPLADYEADSVPPERFARLREIVASMHARGIALKDLHYRDILFDEQGGVWVIDFAAATLRGERPGPLRRRWFDHFCHADRFSIARLGARFGGEDPAAAIAGADPRVLAWHRRARRLKWRWDKLRGAKRLPPVDDHWKL